MPAPGTVLPLFVLMLAPLAASASDAYSAKTYPRGAARNLIVDTDSGAITLRQAVDGPISVDISPAAAPGDDCRVSQVLRNGTLHLSAHAARNAFGMKKTCSAGLTVVAYFDDIRARSESGGVDLGILCRKADISTGSGSILLRRTSAEMILRSGSGAISGEAAGAKIDAATGSGDIRLSGLTGLVKAKSGSGAVALDWASSPAAGAIGVNTGSGSLNASFPKATRLMTSLRSATGEIRNDFDDKDAKLTLTFKSGSGNATVTRKP